jgi:hypothetical protein
VASGELSAALLKLTLRNIETDIVNDINRAEKTNDIGELIGNIAGNLANLTKVVSATIDLLESKCP